MISSHPAEHYFQVSLLPPDQFFVVTADIKAVGSTPDELRGIECDIVTCCSEGVPSLNLYHASTFVVEATAPDDAYDKFSEISRMRVVAEVRPADISATTLRTNLEQRITKTLPSNTLQDLRVRPLLAPLAFIATNIGNCVDDEYLRMGIELCHVLKELYLCPVFLPSVGGETIVSKQMIRLLDASPLLVAVFVPKRQSAAPSGRKFWKKNRKMEEQTPALWPMFEELYHSLGRHGPSDLNTGNRGVSAGRQATLCQESPSANGINAERAGRTKRFTYRMLHNSVPPPKHMDGLHVSRFVDHDEFTKKLDQLRQSIETDKAKTAWRDALDECNIALQNISAGHAELQFDDPELAFERHLRSRE